MGDDIGSGSVTGCRLWLLGDHRQHTQLHWAALRQKLKQTEPQPMSSLINYPAYYQSQNQVFWFVEHFLAHWGDFKLISHVTSSLLCKYFTMVQSILRKAKIAFNRNGNIDTGLDIENSIEASNLTQFSSNWKRTRKPIFSD